MAKKIENSKRLSRISVACILGIMLLAIIMATQNSTGYWFAGAEAILLVCYVVWSQEFSEVLSFVLYVVLLFQIWNTDNFLVTPQLTRCLDVCIGLGITFLLIQIISIVLIPAAAFLLIHSIRKFHDDK